MQSPPSSKMCINLHESFEFLQAMFGMFSSFQKSRVGGRSGVGRERDKLKKCIYLSPPQMEHLLS